MSFCLAVRAFLRRDAGAVAVDWTVLAASVVGLGVASVGAVRGGVGALGSDVQSSLSATWVAGANMVGSTLFTPQVGATGIWAMPWGFDSNASYDLDGWTRTDTAFGLQYIASGNYIGVTSLSGGYMIDMGYGGNTALARTVEGAVAGQSYTVSVTATDPLYGYAPGSQASVNNRLEVWYGGQQIGTIQPGSNQMQRYDFQVTGGMGNGSNQLELRSRQDASHVLGVFLEDVTVR